MIVWGKKTVYSNLGFVADFCPMCASARPFSLQRIGSAGHVYFISAGEGELVGYQRTCATCHILLRADPVRYATIAKKPESLATLLKATFPNFQEVYQAQLAIEARIQADPASLSPQDRLNLIITPFTLLSSKVARRYSTNSFGNQGFVKKEVIPALANTLKRLNPTEAELRAAMARMVQLKESIGSKLKLGDLMAELKRMGAVRPSGSTNARADAADDVYVLTQSTSDSGALFAYQKAGRLLRILAWISIVGTVGLAISVLMPQTSAGATAAGRSDMVGVLIYLAILTAGLFAATHGVMRHQTWGRVLGIVYGALVLFGFPIGTAIGGYLLWQLIGGWKDGDSFA